MNEESGRLSYQIGRVCDAIVEWRVIDLSLPLIDGISYYPGDPAVRVVGPYSALPTDTTKEYCYLLTLSTQSGTHIQAPHYFLANGQCISEIPVSRFRSAAFVVDLTQGPARAKEEIVLLSKMCELRGTAIIFRSGSCDHMLHGQGAEEPLSISRNGSCRSVNRRPCITMELARLLVDNKIGMVGIDAIGFEPSESPAFDVNRYLCANGILIIEGLCRLSQLPCNPFVLEAFPLSVIGVEGTPCRAIALVPTNGE